MSDLPCDSESASHTHFCNHSQRMHRTPRTWPAWPGSIMKEVHGGKIKVTVLSVPGQNRAACLCSFLAYHFLIASCSLSLLPSFLHLQRPWMLQSHGHSLLSSLKDGSGRNSSAP